ncbi:hypothetical protein ACWDY4_45990 [Streptomyces olivaceoviridis]
MRRAIEEADFTAAVAVDGASLVVSVLTSRAPWYPMTPEAAQEWMRKASVPGEAGWDDMWNVGIRMHDAVSVHRFIEVLLKPPIRVNATADHLRGVLQEHGVNGITAAGPDIICVRLCGDDLARL